MANFFTIPSAINSAFVEKGGQGLIDKLMVSEKSAAESSVILNAAAGKIGEFEPIQMYKCPSNSKHLGDAAWASFGCLGQYSATNSCSNKSFIAGIKEVSMACDPVILFKKK